MDWQALFPTMMERRASYLYLVPGSPIMIKEKGNMAPLDQNILYPKDTKEFADSLMLDWQKEIYAKNLEISFSYSIPGLSRFRINIFQQRGSIAAVISTHPSAVPSLEELGLPESVKNLTLNAMRGLILICGPKSSGKSYTMAGIINYLLETRNCQIVTMENPIDFLHKNRKGIICQREVGIDLKSYAGALDSMRGQGADVLAISEIASFEIAKTIFSLAAGGMLVIAVAQAPSVMLMLETLFNMFPPQYSQQGKILLAESMSAIICQTLLNKPGGDGLVLGCEILIGTPQIKNLIKEGKSIQIHTTMGASARDTGMQTQEQAFRYLVKRGLITVEEAYAKAARPEEFRKIMTLPY